MPEDRAIYEPAPEVHSWRTAFFWACFVTLLGFHFVANYWWQALDNRPVRTDEEVHMVAARDYYEAFTLPEHDSLLKHLVAISEVRPGNPVHPPLLHVSGALAIMIFGYSTDVLSLTNTFYFLLLLLGCYCLARRFLSPWEALFCLFVVSFTPIVYSSSHHFMTDFTSSAVAVWTIYALLRTDFFHNTQWVFVFALLNGLGILTRTVNFLFYLVPCLLLVAVGFFVALRLGDGLARRIALQRWVFNCVLTFVVSAGVFAPWYFRNIDYYYEFWGGKVTKIALAAPQELRDDPSLRQALGESSAVAEGTEQGFHAAALNPLQLLSPVLNTVTAQAKATGLWEKILNPRVEWWRYPVHLVNNALFFPLLVLSLLGCLVALLFPRYRNWTTFTLVLTVFSSWVLFTILIRYSNPRYTLPAVPVLSMLAAVAVIALKPNPLRYGVGAVLAAYLLFQYVHLSFVPVAPVERADIPIRVEQDRKKFGDPGMVLFKHQLYVSDAFSPVGRPKPFNYKDRVMEALVAAEKSQPFVTGEYANFQRLNIRGFELDQKHYWPDGQDGPNPYRRPDYTAEQLPSRRLRTVGLAMQPDQLLPRMATTDYVVYAVRPDEAGREEEFRKFLQERDFVLFDRFESPEPRRTFGIMVRKPEGELVAIAKTADVDQLNLFDLYGFISSSRFGSLPEPIQAHAQKRLAALTEPYKPFYQMNDAAELVTMNVARAEEGWYELRLLFRVTARMKKDYRMLFNFTPVDPAHLPVEKREQGYVDAHFNPVPPTSEWEPGTFVLLRKQFQAAPVPYRFAVLFIEDDRLAYGMAAQTPPIDLSAAE